jgi:hypothetical protein
MALLCLSALLAGAMNSIAGGGTLLTFPSLLAALTAGGFAPDVASVTANATSTVSLLPGSVAGAWGFRRELQTARRWLGLLLIPSLLGGITGTLLVTELDPKWFGALVPWMILVAATLYLLQPLIARWTGIGLPHAPPTGLTLTGVTLFQFLVGLYGGYFGAGIGILMLSSLALMGLGDIHRMNALKTILASAINSMSVVIFVAKGIVVWPYAIPMAAAAIAGGYFGARLSRRLNRTLMRWVVIAIGYGLAIYFFAKASPASRLPESPVTRSKNDPIVAVASTAADQGPASRGFSPPRPPGQ